MESLRKLVECLVDGPLRDVQRHFEAAQADGGAEEELLSALRAEAHEAWELLSALTEAARAAGLPEKELTLVAA